MSGKFLLDTNIIIALFGGEAGVKERLALAGEVFISSIVLGELYYGAHKSQRAQESLARLDDFAASCAILICDRETAREYGMIKNQLLQQGRPIPENDIWVAATAQQHNLTLITRDDHFSEVAKLKMEVW